MKLFVASLVVFSVCGIASADPSIKAGGVVNNASSALQGLPNSAIAQGSIFNVYGADMGPSTLVSSGFPLQTNFQGTSLSVTVNGTTTNPFIIYTREDVIAAVLPSGTPAGTGTITVTYNGSTSAPQPITVVKSSFGIYTINEQGNGPGVTTDKNFKVLTPTNSAKPGQKVILWATGAGPVSSDESKPPTTTVNLQNDINAQVYVGGKTVTPVFVGRSGCCSGLDQVIFTVPDGVAGCYVSVSVQVGGTSSNFVTLPIAPQGSACSDPNGLTAAELAILDSQGSLKIGFVDISRTTTTTPSIGPVAGTTTTTDGANAGFLSYDKNTLERSQGVFRTASIGSCVVYTFSGSSSQTSDPFKAKGLDAGSAIPLSGPNLPAGTQLLPISQVPGFYDAPITGDPFNAGGSYVFTGNGGADVKAFRATVNAAPALTWTNAASITTVNRAAGQLVTWTGGDPNGTVQITGLSIASLTAPFIGASFTCTAATSALHFNIPGAVLSILPPGPSDSPFPLGTLAVGSQTSFQSFTAPGINVGWGIVSDTTSESVSYQ